MCVKNWSTVGALTVLPLTKHSIEKLFVEKAKLTASYQLLEI